MLYSSKKGRSVNIPQFWRFFFLVLPLLLVSGCGFVQTASAAGEPPTTLQVQRINHLPGNRYPPFSPRTITDQQAVQRLYAAAQALPPLNRSGIMHCPVDLALDYQLDFSRGQTRMQEIVLHPTGCSSVEFGKNDARKLTPAFEQLFMQTVGISKLVPGPL